MKCKIMIVSVLLPVSLLAQLSLDSCINSALRNFQFDEDQLDIEESSRLALNNIGRTWYPDLNFDYTSTYQNQQIEFPSAFPGAGPEVPLDFHRALVNFSQTIYDGSISTQRKKLENGQRQGRLYELEVQRMNLKSQVVKVYMSLLLLDESIGILRAKYKVLKHQNERVGSAVDAGIAQQLEAVILETELLSVYQSQVELESQQLALRNQLAVLTALQINENVKLEIPVTQKSESAGTERPEISFLKNQINLLDAQKKLTSKSRLPKVRLFGSAGMGNPGYNILDPSWQPMAIVGVGLRWEIWDWKETGNRKKIQTIQQRNIGHALVRQEIAIRSELINQEAEIDRLERVIAEDDKITIKRKQVSEIRAAQLQNGIITSTEYITDLNRQEVAELNRSVHELQLIQAHINYNIISGH